MTCASSASSRLAGARARSGISPRSMPTDCNKAPALAARSLFIACAQQTVLNYSRTHPNQAGKYRTLKPRRRNKQLDVGHFCKERTAIILQCSIFALVCLRYYFCSKNVQHFSFLYIELSQRSRPVQFRCVRLWKRVKEGRLASRRRKQENSRRQ